MSRTVFAILGLACSVVVLPAMAQAPAVEAHSIIQKMTDRNPELVSYQAPVHVDLRMLNFPFLAPTLDGTTYYKKPGKYEVVFTRVPSYAKGFEKLFNDIGDPGAWEKDQNVSYLGTQQIDGRALIVLSMAKKVHSTILDHTLAFVDPQTYQLWKMVWHYTSGGTIAMRQWYRSEGGFDLLSQQYADINIPHIHAVADSKYGTYQTNVPIDDAVFTKK